jgi:hypothetical protein
MLQNEEMIRVFLNEVEKANIDLVAAYSRNDVYGIVEVAHKILPSLMLMETEEILYRPLALIKKLSPETDSQTILLKANNYISCIHKLESSIQLRLQHS